MSENRKLKMKLIDFKDKLFTLLYEACTNDIDKLKKDMKCEKIFSYAIFCHDGMTAFYGAACSREYIEKYKDNKKDYLNSEVMSAEWNYLGCNASFFKELNKVIDNLIEADYEGELTGIYLEDDFDGSNYDQYYQFYINLFIEVIVKLKSSSIFEEDPFEQDVLLGIQYADPGKEAIESMLKVSEKVNSPKWHKKMLEAYSS